MCAKLTIWMPNFAQELHLRRVQRIVFGELELCGKDAALEGSAIWPLDQGFPDEQVILVDWACSDAVRRVGQEGLVLLEQTLRSNA
jgi:hypothetical protein